MSIMNNAFALDDLFSCTLKVLLTLRKNNRPILVLILDKPELQAGVNPGSQKRGHCQKQGTQKNMVNLLTLQSNEKEGGPYIF